MQNGCNNATLSSCLGICKLKVEQSLQSGRAFTAWVCSPLADIPTSPKGLITRKGKASCKPSIPTACWRLKGLLCGVFVCLFACSCFCFETAPCSPGWLCPLFQLPKCWRITGIYNPSPSSPTTPHQCIHIHLFLYSSDYVFCSQKEGKRRRPQHSIWVTKMSWLQA